MGNKSLINDIKELRVVEDSKREALEADRISKIHPKGWEPGVEFNGEWGVLSTGPRTEPGAPSNAEWTELLDIWDLDPETYEIDPNYSPEFRAWDANMGNGDIQRFYYYKARVRLRARWYGLDIEDLLKGISAHKRTRLTTNEPTDPVGVVLPLADWQIGKGPVERSSQDGVKATVDRILTGFDRAEDYLAELRRWGVQVGCLYMIAMGDMQEKCIGNYPMQLFSTELNHREQTRLTRRLLRDGIIRLSKKMPKVVVGAVGGNHGEVRSNTGGKFQAVTSPGDNDDIAVVEMVADALSHNEEAFGHVSFLVPDESLSFVLDIYGVPVGFTHGHLATRGATPEQKMSNWLKDQSFSDQPIGDSRILVHGHWHHFSIVDHGPKTIIGCPSNDGGSAWFEDRTGAHSTSGTLIFCVGESLGNGSGFDRLQIL